MAPPRPVFCVAAWLRVMPVKVELAPEGQLLVEAPVIDT